MFANSISFATFKSAHKSPVQGGYPFCSNCIDESLTAMVTYEKSFAFS